MALINFKLRHPDEIVPWGIEPDRSLSWFALTDSDYWLELGKIKLYEYSNEIYSQFENPTSQYVDYQLSRFIEDFTELFGSISESIPNRFYVIVKDNKSLTEFYNALETWLNEVEETDTDFDAHLDNYEILGAWIDKRQLTAGHLVGGPKIGFFRNLDKVAIVWNADYVTKENIPMWSAQNGQIEIDFSEFLKQVEDFGARFFVEMNKQVDFAINKDWGTVHLDKIRLVGEHRKRKIEFYEKLEELRQTPKEITNWAQIANLLDKR